MEIYGWQCCNKPSLISGEDCFYDKGGNFFPSFKIRAVSAAHPFFSEALHP